MTRLRSTEVKLIGAFFLVAGVWGFVVFLSRIFPLNNFLSFLNIFPTVLFGLTFYSGFLLLLKEDNKGLEIGRAIIAVQIINFNIAGLEYLFVTGAYIFCGFTNLKFAIKFGFENTFWIGIYDEPTNFVLRLNILALAVFLYLSRTIRIIDIETEAQDELDRVNTTLPPSTQL
jgi:hypothetical protein